MDEYLSTYSLVKKLNSKDNALFREVVYKKVDSLLKDRHAAIKLEFTLIFISFAVLIGTLFLLPLV